MNADRQEQQPDTPVAEDEKIVAEVTETNFDTVIRKVLDAGDVANRTASMAADSTQSLINAVEQMRDAHERTKIHAVIVLGVTGLLLLMAVGIFVLMARQLHDSLDAADAAVLAVGKRIVQLNSGVEYLKEVQESVANIEQRLTAQSAGTDKLGSRIDGALAELRKANSEIAEKLAKPPEMRLPANLQSQLQAQSQALQQIQAAISQLKTADRGTKELGAQLAPLAKSIQKMSEQLAQLQGGAGKINAIAQNVDSILSLQKQKAPPVQAVAPPPPPPQPAPRRERTEVQGGAIRYPYANPGEPAKGVVQSGAGAGAGKSEPLH